MRTARVQADLDRANVALDLNKSDDDKSGEWGGCTSHSHPVRAILGWVRRATRGRNEQMHNDKAPIVHDTLRHLWCVSAQSNPNERVFHSSKNWSTSLREGKIWLRLSLEQPIASVRISKWHRLFFDSNRLDRSLLLDQFHVFVRVSVECSIRCCCHHESWKNHLGVVLDTSVVVTEVGKITKPLLFF